MKTGDVVKFVNWNTDENCIGILLEENLSSYPGDWKILAQEHEITSSFEPLKDIEPLGLNVFDLIKEARKCQKKQK